MCYKSNIQYYYTEKLADLTDLFKA